MDSAASISAPGRTHWQVAWRKLKRDRLAMLALFGILAFIVVAVFAEITDWRREIFEREKRATLEMIREYNGYSACHAEVGAILAAMPATPDGAALAATIPPAPTDALWGRRYLEACQDAIRERYPDAAGRPDWATQALARDGRSDPAADLAVIRGALIDNRHEDTAAAILADVAGIAEPQARLDAFHGRFAAHLHQLKFRYPFGLRDPIDVELRDQRRKPRWLESDADRAGRSDKRYWLGSDNFGRDVLARLVMGSTVALKVALIAEGIAILAGVLLGALAGYFGRWVDDMISWLSAVFWAFPFILLVIVMTIAIPDRIGPFALTRAMKVYFAVGIASWVEIARIVRAQFLSLREKEFVEAARALGGGHARIIFRHILPNAIAPILIIAAMGISTTIMSEAGLSFIGLGVEHPKPSWGRAIAESWQNFDHWWIFLFPSLALMAVVFAFNIFGDSLRDALDPRLRTMS